MGTNGGSNQQIMEKAVALSIKQASVLAVFNMAVNSAAKHTIHSELDRRITNLFPVQNFTEMNIRNLKKQDRTRVQVS